MTGAEFLKDASSLSQRMAETVDQLYTGVSRADGHALDEAARMLDSLRSEVPGLTEAAVKLARTDTSFGRYIPVPAYLDRIREDLGRIARTIGRVWREDVPLSDRALEETAYLFERVRDLLVHLGQFLREDAGELVGRHVTETAVAIEHSAERFATKHEERLIEGVCVHRASAIYLDMLGAVKDLAWHARALATDRAS
jgi:Na+/phosphate symporter